MTQHNKVNSRSPEVNQNGNKTNSQVTEHQVYGNEGKSQDIYNLYYSKPV